MDRAGFAKVAARPFSEGVRAPLSRPERAALIALIAMRWQGAEKELGRADRRLYLRLTDPASREFILNQPGYYGFYTYSLFEATAPG